MDINNLDPLSKYPQINSPIAYRIAYMTWCIQNNDLGHILFNDLKAIVAIESAYIQFGSAEWFWERCVNSYILQIGPERSKDEDRSKVSREEGSILERVRVRFFKELEKVIFKHQNLIDK